MVTCIFLLVLLAIMVTVFIRIVQERKRLQELKAEEERKAEERRLFREKCVAMVKSGMSIRKVSRDMAVPYSSLRAWVKKEAN